MCTYQKIIFLDHPESQIGVKPIWFRPRRDPRTSVQSCTPGVCETPIPQYNNSTRSTVPFNYPARAETRVVYSSQRPPWSFENRPVAENAATRSVEHSAPSDGPPEYNSQYGVFPPVSENFQNNKNSAREEPPTSHNISLKSEIVNLVSEVAKVARGDGQRTLASLPTHDIIPYQRHAGMNISQWIEQMEFRFKSLNIPEHLWVSGLLTHVAPDV